MSFQLQGNSGTVAEVEANTRALRTTPRPIDVGSLGSYAVAVSTGSIAAGAQTSQPVFSVRWTDATGKVMLVRVVRVALYSQGTGFTAGSGALDLIVARSYTAMDTGGTNVVLTTNNAKRRTSFATSLLTAGTIIVSTTAVLGAGTRTLDTNALGIVHFGVPVTTNFVIQPTVALFAPDFSGEWPLVLTQNEGFEIRATVPATGIWSADISMEWTEVASF